MAFEILLSEPFENASRALLIKIKSPPWQLLQVPQKPDMELEYLIDYIKYSTTFDR